MKKRFRGPVMSTAIGVLVAGGLVAAVPQAAQGYGTLSTLGQDREHERITRVLGCDAVDRPEVCFEPQTLDQLAGDKGSYGAVGTPDNVLYGLGPAKKHCDDGDYAVAGVSSANYGQGRKKAEQALRDCIEYYDEVLDNAVKYADALVVKGKIVPKEVNIYTGTSDDECSFPPVPNPRQPAKCEVLNGLGRALHLAEDFWAHTNWADTADPNSPIGRENPPGLDRTDIPDFFQFPTPKNYSIPAGLISGCDDSNPVNNFFRDPCKNRITHGILNKDKGKINARTGNASDPKTKRGRIGDNFQQSVTGARAQAKFTWNELVERIQRKYPKQAELIVKAIVDDTPWTNCEKVRGKSKYARAGVLPDNSSRVSVDVDFDNRTGSNLRCAAIELDAGQWTNRAENRMLSGDDDGGSRWGSQSSTPTGTVEGEARYRINATGEIVTVSWQNQAVGQDSYGCDAPDGYDCTIERSGTNRNRTLSIVLSEG